MHNNKYLVAIFLCLFFTVWGYGQIQSNLFLQQDVENVSSHPGISNASYLEYPKVGQMDSLGRIEYGFDISTMFQNSALSPYQVYNDPVHYLISPFGYIRLNKHIELNVRGNIENIKDELVYPQRPYWSDELAGHRGGIEIAKITYNSEYFFVKFGRDYFLQGPYFYENLLFSKYNYPYDQFVYGFKNKFFELSAYYLALNSFREGDVINLRHLNGHRLSINLGIGYFAINEVILYGGENRQMNVMLLNPLLAYYSYQKNAKNFESNSLVSSEIYLCYKDYFIFGEFLLDDFQIDNDVPGDLEPTEWGMNVTAGWNNIIENINWKINYTKVANRTYNAPEKDYEKFIYKNYPIGHFLGNNFWELQSTVGFNPQKNARLELNVSHIESGGEALYAPFNKDYMNYTVDEGYSEPFPFGNVNIMTGLHLSGWYNVNKELLVKLDTAYWLDNYLLEKDFAYGLGLAYRLSN